jgi:hypothetical protein
MNDPADHAIVNPMGPRRPRGRKGSIRHPTAPLHETAESSARGCAHSADKAAPNRDESCANANANANMATGLVASDPAATDPKAKSLQQLKSPQVEY